MCLEHVFSLSLVGFCTFLVGASRVLVCCLVGVSRCLVGFSVCFFVGFGLMLVGCWLSFSSSRCFF